MLSLGILSNETKKWIFIYYYGYASSEERNNKKYIKILKRVYTNHAHVIQTSYKSNEYSRTTSKFSNLKLDKTPCEVWKLDIL